MSKLVSGTFVFDEPPCNCSREGIIWNAEKNENGKIQLIIGCEICERKSIIPNDKWFMSLKFIKKTNDNVYKMIDNCKVIPLFKKK